MAVAITLLIFRSSRNHLGFEYCIKPFKFFTMQEVIVLFCLAGYGS